MATTTRIEIDSELLDGLRSRHPGKQDRELIEDLARLELGFAGLRASQTRNSLPEDEAMQLAVEAVHASRQGS